MRWQPFLFVLLGACSGAGDVTIDITHDVCAPIAVTSATPTDIQTRGIDAALTLWRNNGVAAIGWLDRTALVIDPAPSPIDIQFEAAAPAARGLYDDENGVIYINDALTNPQMLEIVIAHELGHAFGLEHVEGRPSIMNKANLTQSITPEDVAALQALWGECRPSAPVATTSSASPPGS
ncbi:MAG: matrixin family metalloprotease [Kofleriaceae bacterium]|nr:matrixin family metalloprotease [Kofleriaceae bacterium]